MKKTNKILLFLLLVTLTFSPNAYPYSARHHLINVGKSAIKIVIAPLHGLLIKGPQNIKDAYTYEAGKREKKEKRELLRYKLFAIWRAPGEEAKGIIDGVVEAVQAGGDLLKNFLSIFFSD